MSGNGWQHIRSLDVTENWHERTAVISKTDHQNHTTWARVGLGRGVGCTEGGTPLPFVMSTPSLSIS